MKQFLLLVVVGSAIGFGGISLANHSDAHGDELVKVLSERDVAETINGKPARVTTVEVTFDPGVAGKAHRHPGPIFGYVIEGDFELALDDQPVQKLKAGETFYEPGGSLHRVAKNPSTTVRTRILAVILHPRDAKQLVEPVSGEKK
jgi:quercetin dioxygenase-like cupin family protein